MRAFDLHAYLVRQPGATFVLRAEGAAVVLPDLGRGDLLVVDRALPPQNGDVVVATADGALALARYRRRGAGADLYSLEGDGLLGTGEAHVWGVVTAVVRRLR